MNLKAQLRNAGSLTATQSVASRGGGGGGASTWNEISGKPFNTLGDDFAVNGGALEIADGVIPSLDGYATEQYVDGATTSVYAEAIAYAQGLTTGLATEQYVDDAVSAITPTIPSVSATTSISNGEYIGSVVINGETVAFRSPLLSPLQFKRNVNNNNEPIYATYVSGGFKNANMGLNIIFTKINNSEYIISKTMFAQICDRRSGYVYIYDKGSGNSTSGRIILGDIDTDPTDFTYEGFNKISSIVWDGNNYKITASAIYITDIVADNLQSGEKANIDPYFLPLDGYATEQYVNSATTAVYDGITTTLGDYATIQYVDGATTTVANSIPTADNTTIIDNNGVWSAVGSGVDIDNKSIIKNQDDELQTAVPLYSEEITEVHNTIRQWDSQYNSYGSTDSAYVTYCKNNTISDASTYYTVFVNYTYDGNDYTVSSKVNNIKGSVDNIDQNSDLWAAGFHTFRLVDYYYGGVNHNCWMWCSNQTYTVNWVMIKEVPYDETYSSSDITYSYTQYHQIPGEYLPIKVFPKQTSGQEVGTIEIDGNATTLYAPNVSVGYGLKETSGTITLNSELNSFGPVDFGLTSQEQYLRLLTGSVANYIGGGIIKTASTDSANDIKMTTWPKLSFDSSSTRREKWYCTNFITDRNYRKVHAITPYYKWYDNRWFGPYYISGIFIGEYDANTTPTYNIRVEGWESILDSITWNASSNRYDFLLKEDICINPNEQQVPFPFVFYQGRDNIPDPQKVNSYFLPLDNSTIVRDSDGNIKTAIPPCPTTTAGTYTLQATVDGSGNITYSWI